MPIYIQTIDEDLDKPESADFDYILSQPILNLAEEKKKELLSERDRKKEMLENFRQKASVKMWRAYLHTDYRQPGLQLSD